MQHPTRSTDVTVFRSLWRREAQDISGASRRARVDARGTVEIRARPEPVQKIREFLAGGDAHVLGAAPQALAGPAVHLLLLQRGADARESREYRALECGDRYAAKYLNLNYAREAQIQVPAAAQKCVPIVVAGGGGEGRAR